MSSTNSEIGRFFQHSTIYAVGNILNRLGAFLLLPVYTNYLAVEQYGALELFYATTAVFSGFLSVGLAHATLRFYFAYEDPEERKSVVSTNYFISLLIAITGVTLIGIWHQEIVQYVFRDEAYNKAILIVLCTLVLELSSQVCLAYLRAVERSVMYITVVLIKLLIQVVVNAYLVIVMHGGVEGVLAGNLTAVATGWIILSVVTLKNNGFRVDRSKSVPVLKYSFPFLLSTITALISINVDKFLLSRLISMEAIGIYGLAMKFGLLIEQLIGEPFNKAYGAFRFSIMHRKDASHIQSSIVRYLVIGGTFASLGIVYFVPDLLHVMSDQKYWSAIDILPLLVFANLIKILYYPLQTGILVEKKTKYIFYIGLIVATVSVIANFVMIKLLGIVGACIAQIALSMVLVVLTNTISQRYHYVDYDYLKMIAVVGIAILFFLVGKYTYSLPTIISLLLKSMMLGLFPVALILTRLITPEEKGYAITWIRKKLSARRMEA